MATSLFVCPCKSCVEMNGLCSLAGRDQRQPCCQAEAASAKSWVISSGAVPAPMAGTPAVPLQGCSRAASTLALGTEHCGVLRMTPEETNSPLQEPPRACALGSSSSGCAPRQLHPCVGSSLQCCMPCASLYKQSKPLSPTIGFSSFCLAKVKS